MSDNVNQIKTQNPIQVRKVSQLENFIEYLTDGRVKLENAFFLVSYPTNDEKIPHNYKINLQDFGGLIIAFVNSEFDKIRSRISVIEEHIRNEHIDDTDEETFEYYWNLYAEDINNNLQKIAPWAPNNSEYDKIVAKWNDIIEEAKLKGLI